MTLLILALLIALVFGVGVVFDALKIALIVAFVLLVAGAISGFRTYR